MYRYLRSLLFRLDAERAHDLTMGAARLLDALDGGLVDRTFGYEHERLTQDLWGLTFPNPIGLAAGFDKNGELPRFWERLGFGFSEIGSVTHRPSDGNPRPRAFRLPRDRALVNRMGLNNDGSRAVFRRLNTARHRLRRPIGINVAKTPNSSLSGDEAVEDVRRAVRDLIPVADYLTINLSCPNTPGGRTFQAPENFRPLGEAVAEEREHAGSRVPILVKLSPPAADEDAGGSELDALLEHALDLEIDGLIATNTASDRTGLRTPPDRLEQIGDGGLSGAPLADRSTRLVAHLHRRVGADLPIVGVGGVDSVEAAYRRIRAGASLLQLYTGLVFEGPGLIGRIKRGLVDALRADGFDRITEAVGVDA